MKQLNQHNHGSFAMQPIGVIHSCFTEKFGIPRQPGLVKSATATLELFNPFNRHELVRGLRQFSHIWIIFLFHETLAEGWKPTVRPPLLGGKKRVGVFASRSPHRPNHLGMSAVKLEEIRFENGRCSLVLSGIDLLDGTPVVDIKPYAPYSDIIADADCGYADGFVPDVRVVFSREAEIFCEKYEKNTQRALSTLVRELIAHDPRPASQKSGRSMFGMRLWDVNVRWKVDDDTFTVLECALIHANSDKTATETSN